MHYRLGDIWAAHHMGPRIFNPRKIFPIFNLYKIEKGKGQYWMIIRFLPVIPLFLAEKWVVKYSMFKYLGLEVNSGWSLNWPYDLSISLELVQSERSSTFKNSNSWWKIYDWDICLQLKQPSIIACPTVLFWSRWHAPTIGCLRHKKMVKPLVFGSQCTSYFHG